MNHNNKQIRHILAMECGNWKQTFFLNKSNYSLGRNSTNSLFCYHRAISRNHASLVRINYNNLNQKDEHKHLFWVVDGDLTGNRSTNGIYVNGKKCRSHQLKPGDIIFFGGIDVKAKYDILNLESRSFYSLFPPESSQIMSLDSFSDGSDESDEDDNSEDISTINLDEAGLNNFELISEAMLLVDSTTKDILNANNKSLKMLGYSFTELQNLKITDLDYVEEDIIRSELESLQKYHVSSCRESIYRKKDQELVNVAITSMSVHYEGKDCYLLLLQDISQSKKIEDVLRYQNNHDLLTNVGNQQLFNKQLSYCLGYNTLKETQLAVVQIKFNNNTHVTKQVTHSQEKQIEKKIISHLKKEISTMDAIAKLTNYQYYILLEEVKTSSRIELLIDHIWELVKSPIVIDDESFLLTANVGVSVHPEDGQEVDELLHKSNLALEVSCQIGANNCQYYQPILNYQQVQDYERNKLLMDILDQHKVDVKYQPIIDVENNKITALNAQISLNEDVNKISSGEILKSAQQMNYTQKLLQLCLQQIAIDFDPQQVEEESLNQVNINFPILASSLINEQAVHGLVTLLNDYQEKIPNLSLEVINDLDLVESDRKQNKWKSLDKLSENLTLSNFDFSQGMNLLNRTDNFSKIKISLPEDINLENDSKYQAFITSLSSFAQTCELDLVVSGIETESQQKILSELGCNYLEGSFFSVPLIGKNIIDFVKSFA